MRVLYFHRMDGVHDRRFIDALGHLPVDVFTLRLENPARPMSEWKPATNIHPLSFTGGINKFNLYQMSRIHKTLQQIVRDYQIDVVHAGPVDQCAWLAARANLVPLVSMSWGFDLLVNAKVSSISRRRIKYTLERTTILLDDCQTVSNAAAAYGFPQAQIITFPWGVDLKAYYPRDIKKSGNTPQDSKSIVLLSTRTMEKLYGCDVIIEAFIEAARQEPGLRMIMLGDGNQRQNLMRRIAAVELEDRVHFAGNLPEDEMTAQFHASDIYISASQSDGSSVSLLQAMACGLPAIVSDIPGNREWVSEGRNGWLFKVGDHHELARLMIEASRSLELRSDYGKTSRIIVKDRANWGKNFPRLMDAYRMAIELGRAGDAG